MSRTKDYADSEEYIQNLVNPDGTCDLGRFTVINNSLRDEMELGEIIAATGAALVVDAVAFTPKRMALLNVIAIASTEVRIQDEEHLTSIVNHLHNKVLPSIEKFIQTGLVETETKISSNVENSFSRFEDGTLDQGNPVDKLIEETYKTVQGNIDKGIYTPGKYNPGETIDSVVKKVLADKLYKAEVYKEVKRITEVAISEAIDQAELISIKSVSADKQEYIKAMPLQRLSKHSGADRHTFIIAGPPACGKGGVTAMMSLDASREGIDFDDVAKVNTDFYRDFISSGQILGPNKRIHANLNNDESSMVTDLIYERLNEMVTAGAAPHALLDTVKFRGAKIDYGIRDGGVVVAKMISLDPEIAVSRAIKRAEEIGRSVPTEYMLTAHRNLAGEVDASLERYSGANIQLAIYDNNVPWGQMPTLIETVNFQTREIEILNREKQEALYGRRFINTKAPDAPYVYGSIAPILSDNQDLSYIYGADGPRFDSSQIMQARNLGYEVHDHLSGELLGSIYRPDKKSQSSYKEYALEKNTQSYEAPRMPDSLVQLQFGAVLFKIGQNIVSGITGFITKNYGEKVDPNTLDETKKSLAMVLKKTDKKLIKAQKNVTKLLIAKKDELNQLYQGYDDRFISDPFAEASYEKVKKEYQAIKDISDSMIDGQFELVELQKDIKNNLKPKITTKYLEEVTARVETLDMMANNINRSYAEFPKPVSNMIKQQSMQAISGVRDQIAPVTTGQGTLNLLGNPNQLSIGAVSGVRDQIALVTTGQGTPNLLGNPNQLSIGAVSDVRDQIAPAVGNRVNVTTQINPSLLTPNIKSK